MNIQQQESDGKGTFFIEENDEAIAKMTYYFPSPHVMIIDHTEVNDDLKGKNIGSQLVQHGVEYARSKQLKIDPQCPFVKSVFDKNSDYDDVRN